MTDCTKSSEIGHQPRRFIANKEQAHDEIYDEITTDRTDGYMVPAQNVFTDQFKPESSRKINISYCTTNYKQLLIGSIGGCLLTILIVVPTVYFAAKLNSSTAVEDNYLPLKFDKATLHQSAFISEDGLKLSNIYSRDTPVSSVNNSNTLSKHYGIIGNRFFERNRKIYFEVHYQFRVIDKYEPWTIIFVVALAERERVDNYSTVASSRTRGWVYQIHTCKDSNNKTCLTAAHNRDRYPIHFHHQLSPRSKHSGKFRFIVNTSEETFSIIRRSKTSTLTVHSLRNVFSIQRLCPVFGVYSPKKYEVKLSLLKTYDFSKTIWNVVIL